jgi:hypothetical protein
MAVGFKDYLWECLSEAPSAFRRGVIAVTILANIAIVGGLYLGWHLNAFSTFQLWSAAAAVAALEVVLILPYRLWKSNKATIRDLTDRLMALEQERPVAFSHVEFKTHINKKKKTCDISAVVHFNNHSDRMVKWKLLSYSITAHGKTLESSAATTDYFMNRGQRGWYNYPELCDIPFSGWPVTVDVMFDCEYDNVPPLKVRATKRVNRYLLPSLKADKIPAADLVSEER